MIFSRPEDVILLHMSEQEFTREYVRSLITKNLTNNAAVIHREMCSRQSDVTRERNQNM